MLRILTLCTCLGLWFAAASHGQERPSKIDVAEGKISLTAPDTWVRKQPTVRIIEHEFAVPPAEGDKEPGRVTVMGAGGGVQANIDRWYGQFSQPDGGSTRDRAKIEKIDAGGQEVTLVDISGTFKDQRGPVAPAVEKSKQRMLGAIISTKGAGDYFIKFTGPERTVAENQQAFVTMLKSLQQK